eukprot:426705_1
MFTFEERLRWNTLIMFGLSLSMLCLAILDVSLGVFNGHDTSNSNRPPLPLTHKLLLFATIFAFITSSLFAVIELSPSSITIHAATDIYIPQIALILYFLCKIGLWLFSRERAKICLINGQSSFGSHNINGKFIKFSIYPLIVSMVLFLIHLSLSVVIAPLVPSITSIYVPICINIMNEIIFNILILHSFAIEIRKAESIVSDQVSTAHDRASLTSTLHKNILIGCLQIVSCVFCTVFFVYSSFNRQSFYGLMVLCDDGIIQVTLCLVGLFQAHRKQAIYNRCNSKQIKKIKLEQLKREKEQRCSRTRRASHTSRRQSCSMIRHQRQSTVSASEDLKLVVCEGHTTLSRSPSAVSRNGNEQHTKRERESICGSSLYEIPEENKNTNGVKSDTNQTRNKHQRASFSVSFSTHFAMDVSPVKRRRRSPSLNDIASLAQDTNSNHDLLNSLTAIGHVNHGDVNAFSTPIEPHYTPKSSVNGLKIRYGHNKEIRLTLPVFREGVMRTSPLSMVDSRSSKSNHESNDRTETEHLNENEHVIYDTTSSSGSDYNEDQIQDANTLDRIEMIRGQLERDLKELREWNSA